MSREDFDTGSIRVDEIMTKALITVNTSTTVLQIAKMMEQGGIGAVIVKDGDNLVGIVTDRDYATKVAANNLSLDSTADKIMSSPLITINHNDSIAAAAEMMSTKKIRKLAVSNAGTIVGIITSTDLVNQLAK